MEPTIDRLADFRNTRMKRFNSRFYHSLAEATDCFTQNWSEEVNWAVPPIYLVNKVLSHARECKATMVLVVP